MTLTLGDLGEREIVRAIIPRFVERPGDDCAVVPLGRSHLVITTDPVPPPAAGLVGNDYDMYWVGWLLVTINASDLAAAAAAPWAFTAALEAPPTMPVADFERWLAGISDSCRAQGLKYVGGNIKESERWHGVGTAIGMTNEYPPVTRTGAIAGDKLVSVGRGGQFWCDVLYLRAGGKVEKTKSPVFSPKAQLSLMHALAVNSCVSAAIDNSDGTLPSLQQLSEANGLRATLDLGRLPPPEGADSLDVDAVRLWLGWGDWNVLAAVRPNKVQEAQQIADDMGVQFTVVGSLDAGPIGVDARRGSRTLPAPRLESERFAADSWFSSGLESYLDLMLRLDLP